MFISYSRKDQVVVDEIRQLLDANDITYWLDTEKVQMGSVFMVDIVAILFVYNKIKEKITPEINAKVEETLNEWFGAEYEVVK